MLFSEILNPFYIFQAYSVILWYTTEYYYYASCIFLISFVTVINELMATKKNIRNLKAMSDYHCDMIVMRKDKNGKVYTKEVDSDELVPGDKFILKEP